ncbi:40543_t:CDS:1, partial [Gigaspora margarita]
LQKQMKKLNNKTIRLQKLIIKNKNEYNCNIRNLQINSAMSIYNSIKRKDEEINTLRRHIRKLEKKIVIQNE